MTDIAEAPEMGVPYVIFLAPGILTMNVIQNAFANTSSSIMVAKVQGNIVDILMPPRRQSNWCWTLPPVLRVPSHLNPIFCLIDGVRFGLIGRSDSPPLVGALMVAVAAPGVPTLCWWMFKRGTGLKP